MTDTPDLAAWLLEQIAEDERTARLVTGTTDDAIHLWTVDLDDDNDTLAITRARVLAECEAKRRLIDAVFGYESTIDGEWGCNHGAEAIRRGSCSRSVPAETDALRLLALPYADRPGYQEAWRPE